MKLLNGKALSNKFKDELSMAITSFREYGVIDDVTLAVIQI